MPQGRSFPTGIEHGLTCEDVSEGIATGNLQSWMLGPKDIQKECRETTQNAQEAEGSNDPQEQHCLGVHAEICGQRMEGFMPKKHPEASNVHERILVALQASSRNP